MGIARRTAAVILERDDAKSIQRQLQARSTLIADTAAPSMWDELAQAIKSEAQEIAQSIPAAKSLRADQPISNNVTVQTTVAPLHILTLVRTAVGVQSTLVSSSIRHMARRSERHLPPLFFSTDEALRPCFSDGYGVLDLESAVDFLLEPLCDLFGD
jgi:hypothetical protein